VQNNNGNGLKEKIIKSKQMTKINSSTNLEKKTSNEKEKEKSKNKKK
jgi:hypothetical protein